ncbi:glycosyltransferase family 4 protein [Photobacterium sp. SDRW27]|uniref:glycosyltransferase family 4 protein n=1 Tax=Photobacterium obscurum TaxID=2829490 RepID=UPI0022442A2F|nr:glycosyltransferase family 4 protein [Photobacterium obscurum]MCW8332060.1 glycosyltransferase family 4 protein [Photobacterium obscurum]
MVYLLVDSSGFGGIESHIQQLAKLILLRDGAVEVVFIRRYPNHPQYSLLQQQNIPFRFLSDSHFGSFFGSLSANDVVHAHGYKASILARLHRLLGAYRLITSFHAGESVSGKLAFYEWLNRYSSFLSFNLAVSQRIQKSIPFRSQLLRNFIFTSPQILYRQRHRTLQVGFVGRLSNEKGIDRFVEICGSVHDCHFHVFGDGEQSAMVADNPEILWHGSVSSMETYWSQLDLLVITSRAEGLPMAALEAMANGVPVISTNVGEMASLLPSSCLVEESQWQQLAPMIARLAKADNTVWQQLSLQLQVQVKSHFSAESRWPQLAEVYKLNKTMV